jgi:hypothetical protein
MGLYSSFLSGTFWLRWVWLVNEKVFTVKRRQTMLTTGRT